MAHPLVFTARLVVVGGLITAAGCSTNDGSGTDAAAETPDGRGTRDAAIDACAPSGCTGSCGIGSRPPFSHVVDGCLVWECCVPDDAGEHAAENAALADASGE